MAIPNWTSIYTARRDVSEAWADHVEPSSHADVTAYYNGVQPIISHDDENGTEYGEPEDLDLLGIRVTDGGLPVYYSRAEVAEKFPDFMEAVE